MEDCTKEERDAMIEFLVKRRRAGERKLKKEAKKKAEEAERKRFEEEERREQEEETRKAEEEKKKIEEEARRKKEEEERAEKERERAEAKRREEEKKTDDRHEEDEESDEESGTELEDEVKEPETKKQKTEEAVVSFFPSDISDSSSELSLGSPTTRRATLPLPPPNPTRPKSVVAVKENDPIIIALKDVGNQMVRANEALIKRMDDLAREMREVARTNLLLSRRRERTPPSIPLHRAEVTRVEPHRMAPAETYRRPWDPRRGGRQ